MSLRVLCLDHEGGYGGSSRSLYESIRHLPAGVNAEVWCRRQGPVQDRYAALGVPCRIMPDMPHVSSLPRLSRNLYVYGAFLLRWSASAHFRRMLAEAATRFDVVHFNHEGLFLLARWLRKHLGEPRAGLTMHIRTHLPSTVFSRWQYRAITKVMDRLVFITENERDRAQQLAGRKLDGKVIYNIAGAASSAIQRTGNGSFVVATLGNYAFIRGLDRLVDIAVEIKKRGSTGILFIVAGDMTLPKSLPGTLGEVARRGDDLAAYADACGVGDMFRFLGHITDPESVLTACDLVVRPSRQKDPWGRDVLEAMAHGRPVLAAGSDTTFVETGVTGILRRDFDASQWADDILALAQDKDRCARLGQAAQQRVLRLCDGPARAADLAQFWESVRCAA